MSRLIGTDGKLLNPTDEDLVAHVPLKTFKIMQDDLLFLQCLMNQGIDNWDGYDHAIEAFEEIKKQQQNKTKGLQNEPKETSTPTKEIKAE